MRRYKTLPHSNVKIGDVVDAATVNDLTDVDPDEYETDLVQSRRPVDFIGKTPLYETFFRSGKNMPYKYCGICERNKTTNKHPEKAEKVFICSPYKENGTSELSFNLMLTIAACHKAYKNGRIPVAPYLYFPQFMTDDGFDREYGIEAGHILMRECEKMVVYVVDGYISEGMKADIEFASMRLALAPKYIHLTREAAEEFIMQMAKEV